MGKVDFEQIRRWMHRNAREIDLNLWCCLFEQKDATKVADAMIYYQNEDGGFGNGLDPDNWNTNSLPYAALYAIETLELAGFHDMKHPVMQGIYKYLENTGIDGWNFTIPSNQEYPHAIFFNHDEEYNSIERIGVVLTLSAFVIRYMKESKVYQEVCENLEAMLEALDQDEVGDMGPTGYIHLVSAMKEQNIEGFDYKLLDKKLVDIVNRTMQKEEKQWEQYGYRPSDFIRTKDSMFVQGNEDVIERECEYLIRTLPKNDIWPVSWSWFDNAKQYPKEETISLHTAKARKCIERMIFLKAFGRV